MYAQKLSAAVHTFWYRSTKGRIGGRFKGAPVLLLTTIGRKTGKPRTTPLLYQVDGNNLVLVASNGGRDQDPSWWTNLKVNPKTQVILRGETRGMTAREASDDEKASLWPLMVKMYPPYEEYQKKTSREISVVILTPTVDS